MQVHVGTRKGLLTIEKHGGLWKIARTDFMAEPVIVTLDDPRDGSLYAALRLGHFGCKMHRSTDRGRTWTEIKVPEYPPQPDPDDKTIFNPNPSTPWKLEQIWALAAGGTDEPGRLWAGTIPGGLFTSTDHGESWSIVRPLWDRPEREHWFGGGYDHAGIHSVCVDPRDSAHVSVAISCGGVWVTRDRGRTWASKSTGMFAEYMPPDRREDPSIQDPHIMVNCPAAPDHFWVQHHNGVFRSVNDCERWTHVSSIRPSGFGFACAVHPEDPDTAWFVPAVKDETRVPVDGKVVVSRTTDGGRSFEVFSDGLPQDHAFDIVYRHGLDVDASGRVLAMGSTTGSLWISEDAGESWQTVSNFLAPVYSVRFARR